LKRLVIVFSITYTKGLGKRPTHNTKRTSGSKAIISLTFMSYIADWSVLPQTICFNNFNIYAAARTAPTTARNPAHFD